MTNSELFKRAHALTKKILRTGDNYRVTFGACLSFLRSTPRIEPMLANKYKKQSVNGWLMSEKLDGVRAIWNGKQFVSREGNVFNAPTWFTAQLPAQPLDGELYIGRGQLERTAGIVRKSVPVDAEWRMVRFCVFDAPLHDACYKTRLSAAEKLIANCAVASVVQHTACRDRAHLQAFFAALVADGAEGVMVRDPSAAYESGRSNALLKMKPRESAEAVVVGYEAGKTGKNVGRLGALVCTWGGVTFNLGTGLSESARNNPPKIGSRVTFEYTGTTSRGVPREAAFIVVRDYE